MNRQRKINILIDYCNIQETCSECKLENTIVPCIFDGLNDVELDALIYRVFGTQITDNLTGIVKEEPKTVAEILEEVSNELCDHYCKFPNEITDQEELKEKCINCPLQKLN